MTHEGIEICLVGLFVLESHLEEVGHGSLIEAHSVGELATLDNLPT